MNEENGVAGGRTYATDYAADIANHFGAIESDRGAGHPLGLKSKRNQQHFPYWGRCHQSCKAPARDF